MKNKFLPWLIALAALSVSGSAAFYSVSGLGKMFAGASLQVMILASSLEFAKLVTASLLYQYWKKINIGLKIYLSIATLILIIITSAGIYGFLSSAYQETSFKVQNQEKNVQILDKNISIINTEIKNSESQISQKNNRLSQLTNIRMNLQSTQDVLIEKSKSTNSVRQQIKDIDSEIKRMDSEISILNDSISSKNIKISSIEQEKMGISSNQDLAREVGPLKYIAKLTGSNIDSVVNWYIIVLMLVFDPLAISLVIAANFAFEMNTNNEEKINKKMKENLIKKIWANLLNVFKRKNNEIKKEDKKEDKIIEEPISESIENIEEPLKSNDEFLVIQDEINEENLETIDETQQEVVEENIKSDLEINKSDSIINKIEIDQNIQGHEDKYIETNNSITGLKNVRNKFRGNPDIKNSREGMRNNGGSDINPINLR